MNIEVTKWLDSTITEAIKSVYASLDETVDRAASLPRIPSVRRKYITSLEESIKYIHLPYMADQRLLADLFIELYAFKTPRKYRLRKNDKAPPDPSHTELVSIRNILDGNDYIAILGEPGAGKTTFLRRIAYSLCAGESAAFFGENTRFLPVMMECRSQRMRDALDSYQSRVNTRDFKVREMKNDGKSEDYVNRRLPPVPHPFLLAIIEELNEFRFPYPEHLAREMLQKGQLLLFVDGLDEAQQKHRPIISRGLEHVKKHFPRSRAILACRTAEAQNLPGGFSVFEITPLSEEQKQRFVELWFSNHTDDAKDFLNRVLHTHIWSISDRPLLLTLLCALYEKGGDIPKYKVDLYQECAELAMRQWDAIRHVKRQTAFQGMSNNQRMDILSRVAAEMMLEEQTQVSRAILRQRIRTAMEESSTEGSPGDMLDEIVSHTGLVQQVALNAYSFSHKSLQEFFAARHFSATKPSLPIAKLRTDMQWLVTAEMTACMIPDATSVLLAITSKLRRRGTDGFMDLAPAIKLVHENPLTITLKGREKLISRVLHNIAGFSRRFCAAAAMDCEVVEYFKAPYFVKRPYSKVKVETGLEIYIYFDYEVNIDSSALKAMGRAIGFIFRLAIHAPTLIGRLMNEGPPPWVESLLMSALIHTDPLGRRDSTKRLLTSTGKEIRSQIKFSQFVRHDFVR